MPVLSLMINRIPTTLNASQIAREFWQQDVAKVLSITMIPYMFDTEIFYTAYLNIDTWADSEKAYDFIRELQNNDAHIKFSDQVYKVQTNTHNNGNLLLVNYTTQFADSFYATDEDEAVSPITLNFDSEGENIAIEG